jgi:DNA-binding transcriptional regulator YiaG
MSTYLECMAGKTVEKEWTAEQVAELARAAKERGILKEDLANTWLGIHPTTLSDWIGGKQVPKSYHKKLMSCVEPKLLREKVKS